MKLARFQIQNYKVIDDTGWVAVDSRVTALVGKNEAGKTGLMRAMWKSKNVANKKFDKLLDYPRDRYAKERKETQPVTLLEFDLDASESTQLAKQFTMTLTNEPKKVVFSTYYKADRETEYRVRFEDEIETLCSQISTQARVAISAVASALGELGKDPTLVNARTTALSQIEDDLPLWNAKTVSALQSYNSALQTWLNADATRQSTAPSEREVLVTLIAKAQQGDPSTKARQWAAENIPAFIYFSDYGQLETRLHLPTFIQKRNDASEKIRTQVALFEHSHLDPQEILTLGAVKQGGESDEQVQRRKEERSALLDSASFGLTGEWITWWSEARHKLLFSADGDDLVLRVSDDHSQFPMPFEERSQGFQWFFSFYLVFLVESAKAHKGAILLLDEPGLHLHPSLQAKLIRLFDRISETNQLIYSTHLPFLVDGNHLERVRTVYLGGPNPQKTIVSDNVRPGGDKDTLFPIQAAVGYSIAQTLFLGKRSVIVEGITDYWILKALNDALIGIGGHTTIADETILIPAGGTSKLMPLASIMFAVSGVGENQLLILLDSDKEGRQAAQRVADAFGDDSRVMLIGSAFNENTATIEDLVTRDEYADAVRQCGKTFTLTADEQKEIGNVATMQKVFARLNWGEFGIPQKVAAALKLVDSWGKNQGSISPATLTKANQVFAAINRKFAAS